MLKLLLIFAISDVVCSQTTSIDNIQYIVYSKDNNYDLTPETVQYINPSLPTVFVVHGFLSGVAIDNYITNITAAYRDIGYNSIFVDWTGYESALNYLLLIYRGISDIGTALGEKILLLQSHGVDLKQLEIVGASFGAHIAGFAGRYVKQQKNETIHRIAGLDPTGILLGKIYGIFDNPNVLRASDADIVDVTHTNAQTLGVNYNIGSIDVYVNGGQSQMLCNDAQEVMGPLGGAIINSCSHLFAAILYRQTIGNSNYKASSTPDTCENLIVYGDEFNGNATGVYYLRTENVYPYKSIC
ncbi:phospholipase A1-like [Atheta coriaria]|uniref:phospholipase A1-like n=1 Tax=Dalotia coriaria TaxID=877792 RepID=UPI0031F36A9C